VIRQRLEERSLEQIKLAAELFNWTIECGLFLADTKAQAVLRVGSVGEVAPFVLDRILNRLSSNAKHRNPAYQVPPSDFEIPSACTDAGDVLLPRTVSNKEEQRSVPFGIGATSGGNFTGALA
jgi:hypothetical protein